MQLKMFSLDVIIFDNHMDQKQPMLIVTLPQYVLYESLFLLKS